MLTRQPGARPYCVWQYEQAFDGTMEHRLARWVERVERNKWLYITRTIGIATMLIGLNMFIVHQL